MIYLGLLCPVMGCIKVDFNKGEHIVYGSSGVCCIEDIKNIRFSHERAARQYYVLQPIGSQGSKIYIPVDSNSLNDKMRYVLSKDEIDNILQDVKDKEIIWQEDKKVRSEDFKRILKDKNQQEMLLMVSCIYLKKQELKSIGKKLNTTDEILLKEAERCINQEFSFSLNLPTGQVGGYIQSKLGMN